MKLSGSIIAGALSGAVVTAAIWMIVEFVLEAVGTAAGSILAMGFGGPAPPPPSLKYDWAGYGSVAGLLVGAVVGLCAGLTGRDVSGRAVGMLTAAICWTVSAAAVLSVTGFGLLEGSFLVFAVVVLGGGVLLGALVGGSTGLLFKRLGRSAKER